jgi:hypothetical protein
VTTYQHILPGMQTAATFAALLEPPLRCSRPQPTGAPPRNAFYGCRVCRRGTGGFETGGARCTGQSGDRTDHRTAQAFPLRFRPPQKRWLAPDVLALLAR